MRKLFTLFVAVLFTATLWAQTPQKMSYQAVIRNANGALVTNTQIGMVINIRQDSISGNIVYTETQTPTTNANGLVSIEIGGASGFSTINWGANTYYIETRTAIVPPLTNYTITGTSQLLSVPYALHAKAADNGISAAQSSKLSGIAEGAEVNVQADWSQTNSSADDYIKNKPVITSLDGSETVIIGGNNVTISGIGTIDNPYIINSTTSGTGHYIGELFGGGIVVAVWLINGVEHGLIASLTDIASQAPYANASSYLGPTAQSYYDGQINTNTIVAAGNIFCAANYCDTLTSGGFTDWYLPSYFELRLCYEASLIVNLVLGDINGFVSSSITSAVYWSSTEAIFSSGQAINFSLGTPHSPGKVMPHRVRAVRRF